MVKNPLEKRLEDLTQEVMQLRRRIELLEANSASRTRLPETTQSPPASIETGDEGEELVTWMGSSALLPRISAICFILVLALVLRTVTDNNILDTQIGSLIGMAYAALLVAYGWRGYSRQRPLAPVFVVFGAVLMYSIVIETHSHFASLPSIPAYLILVITGIAMATISYLYGNALPVMIGTLGLGIAGIAIDYPNPYFPHLAILLLLANLLGAYATGLQRCSWLRWILLFLTLATTEIWAMKVVGRKAEAATALGAVWFLPVVALFTLAFLGIAVWAAARPGSERISKFDLALPAIATAWSLATSFHMVLTTAGHLPSLGILAFLLGIGQFAFAAWLARCRTGRANAALAFTVAATVAIGFAMSALTGLLSALAVLSAIAWGLAPVSLTWRNRGLRTFSYVVQVGCAGSLAALLVERGPASSPLQQLIMAAAVGMIGLLHFRWSRRTPPDSEASILGRFDPDDRSAVLLLLSGLMSFFFMLRAGIYLVTGNEGMAFQAGQTVVINASAALLVLVAMVSRNREFRNVGILVILIGAGKVFLYDLLKIKGVPLVTSVFSFGLIVTLLSVVLTRWQRQSDSDKGDLAPPADSGTSLSGKSG